MVGKNKDFRLKVSVRQARLLNLIEDKFGSQSEMSRQTGISKELINGFVTMRICPIGCKDQWKDSAMDLSSALGAYPSDIWPEHMRRIELKESSSEVSLDLKDIGLCIDDASSGYAIKEMIGECFSVLTDRQRVVVNMRMDGDTLEEVGSFFNVSRERIRQFEENTHRKIRSHMFRKHGVRGYADAICD